MNFQKTNSLKDCHVGRQPWQNNKEKYQTIKQFKTQTIQTKYDIKTKWKKIIRAKIEKQKNTKKRIKKSNQRNEG